MALLSLGIAKAPGKILNKRFHICTSVSSFPRLNTIQELDHVFTEKPRESSARRPMKQAFELSSTGLDGQVG